MEGTSSTGKVVEEAAAGAADETCSKSKLLSTERKAISGREEHARCRQKRGAPLHPQKHDKKDDKMVYLCARYLLFYVLFRHMASISFLGLMPFSGFFFFPLFYFA